MIYMAKAVTRKATAAKPVKGAIRIGVGGWTNWQFLPTKEFEPADFEAFLRLLPKQASGRALRHAIEVRHDS
jgi:uncharacterized protein YecE (DUF72 family)